jgi:FAD/FMN-containing dehydrogenase
VHEQPDAALCAQPRADLRLAVLVRRAHARGEAVGVEGQLQVADVRYRAAYYPNFVEEPADASAFFDAATSARLQAVKAAYDPTNVFVGNHHIPPA